ncbi:uncharacterized protein LOC129590145 [Paramacrobiotus metropolitanus]|uniref:uncharacterized protein LOC129590145 n=1 Tax=Paramacrobiotus metropolitanus TaxID=2943436 RepID=UPI0024459CCA|nr:uncharacterized protein LOC129590145 [Paramacrobiotus metropolitanus]XP_055341177.1 uncharacterized protein LOC129590145 [Paramacrobiotus metropolitanus]
MPLFLENTYKDTAVLKVYRNPSWLYSHMTLVCRIVGPAVMVAMWALAISAFISLYAATGVYLLFIAILLIFHEFSWLFNKISYLRQDNVVGTCWRMFFWFDSWKRSIEYLFWGIIAFVIGGFTTWQLFVGGALLMLLSVFYFLKAIRFTKIEPIQAIGDIPVNPPPPYGAATAPTVPQIQWGDQYGKY